MKILHSLITRPGLIARAHMYSLVYDGTTIYCIYTGRAANPKHLFIESNISRYKVMADALQSVYDKEILPAQVQIDSGDLARMSKKHSVKFLQSDVTDMHIEQGIWKGSNLYITAGGEKYRFVFRPSRLAEVEAFVTACKS